MAFSLSDYILQVEKRLEVLNNKRIIVFAAWNSEKLFDEFKDTLETYLWNNQSNFVQKLFDEIWEFISKDIHINKELLENVQRLCENSRWKDEDEEIANDIDGIGAIETIEAISLLLSTILTVKPVFAARTSEKNINIVDFEIQFVLEEDEDFEHPLMKNELEKQEEMLNYLENAAQLDDGIRFLFK